MKTGKRSLELVHGYFIKGHDIKSVLIWEWFIVFINGVSLTMKVMKSLMIELERSWADRSYY